MNAPQQMSVDELAEQLALRASRKCADGYAVPFDSDLDQAAASALSSQSLSLSEAREEIERLKGLVAGIREIPARTIDAPGVSERTVLANARRICAQRYKRQPNWVLAMEAFGLGSTWARTLCLRVGADPDGITMEKHP